MGCLFSKVIVPSFIIFIISVVTLTITGYYSIFSLVIEQVFLLEMYFLIFK